MTPLLLTAWLALAIPQAANTPASTTKPPCRNPDDAGKYHVGCGVSAPVVLFQPEPDYPEEAAARKLTTSGVVISLTIQADGHPTNIRIRESMVNRVPAADRAAQQLLEDALLKSTQRYKFKPALFQGKGVPVDMNMEINTSPF